MSYVTYLILLLEFSSAILPDKRGMCAPLVPVIHEDGGAPLIIAHRKLAGSKE
jgi:hypothetical protein